jgi:PAS domain S-box-containing protein
LLKEKVILLFNIAICLTTWFLLFPNSTTEFSLWENSFILFIGFMNLLIFNQIGRNNLITSNIQRIQLIFGLLISSFISYEIFEHGFNQTLISLFFIYLAVKGAYFSSVKSILVFFILSFSGLLIALFTLPEEFVRIEIKPFIMAIYALALIYGYVAGRRAEYRKKMLEKEAVLIAKSNEMEMIFNSLPFHVAYKDKNNCFVRVNKGVAELLNTTIEKLEGKSLYTIFPNETAEKYHQEDKVVIQSKAPITGLVDELSRFDTNEKVWLKCHKIPHFNEHGEVIGIIVCTEDITIQVQSNKMLHSIEERFRKLFEFAPDGMLLFRSLNEGLLKSNVVAQNILGYAFDELSNKKLAEIIHPEDLFVLSKALDDGSFNEGSIYNNEIRLLRSGGTPFFADVTINLILEDNEQGLMFAIFRDVSERKEANNQLSLYAKCLEESNRNLKEFAYAASHDLREPLRTVISYIQLLKRKLTDSETQRDIGEFMTFIEDGSKRMERLLAALLEYSRVGSSNINLEKFDSAEAIVTANKRLSQLFIESNAIMEWDELPEIIADKAQMVSLFSNLISNCIKFRKPGMMPKISISATTNEYEHLFAVSDNGIGIKEEHLEQIFAVFRRLHSVDSIPGTGIGLSTCRRIVQRHGGTIWATSTYGIGTTIYLSLPLHDKHLGTIHSDITAASSGDHFSTIHDHFSGKHLQSPVSQEAHLPKDALSPSPSAEELQ